MTERATWTTDEIVEVAHALHLELQRTGLTPEQYYDQFVAPYLPRIGTAALPVNPYYCKAITKQHGNPWRQCMRGARYDGFCHQHRARTR